MTSLLNAAGIASVLTALFALRYRDWASRRFLFAYYWVIFGLEFVLSWKFLPPGAFGPEVGVVCLALTVLVCAAIYGVKRYERNQGQGQ